MTGRAVGAQSEAATFMRALGKRLRLLRLVRELTQDQLAEATGMSRSFVSLLEHGTHGVDVVRLLRLAAFFGLPLPELVDVGAAVADLSEGLPS